jgi:hypothetical protein
MESRQKRRKMEKINEDDPRRPIQLGAGGCVPSEQAIRCLSTMRGLQSGVPLPSLADQMNLANTARCGSLCEASLIRFRWRRTRTIANPWSTRRSVPLHVIDLPDHHVCKTFICKQYALPSLSPSPALISPFRTPPPCPPHSYALPPTLIPLSLDSTLQHLPISSPTTCQMTLPIISHPCTTICGTRPSQAQLLPVAGSESFSWSYVLFSHTLLSLLVLSNSIDPIEYDHDPKHGCPSCPFDAHRHSNRISLS